VARRLLAGGDTVRLLVRDPGRAHARFGDGFEYAEGQVTDAEAVNHAVQEMNGVHVSVGTQGHPAGLLSRAPSRRTPAPGRPQPTRPPRHRQVRAAEALGIGVLVQTSRSHCLLLGNARALASHWSQRGGEAVPSLGGMINSGQTAARRAVRS
jgi:hypothetical protein